MKIKKNLPDSAMFTGEEKYDATPSKKVDIKPSVSQNTQIKPEKTEVVIKKESKNFKTGFLPEELIEEISEALLKLKLNLKKEEDIVDYDLKVRQEGREVIISAVLRENK